MGQNIQIPLEHCAKAWSQVQLMRNGVMQDPRSHYGLPGSPVGHNGAMWPDLKATVKPGGTEFSGSPVGQNILSMASACRVHSRDVTHFFEKVMILQDLSIPVGCGHSSEYSVHAPVVTIIIRIPPYIYIYIYIHIFKKSFKKILKSSNNNILTQKSHYFYCVSCSIQAGQKTHIFKICQVRLNVNSHSTCLGRMPS